MTPELGCTPGLVVAYRNPPPNACPRAHCTLSCLSCRPIGGTGGHRSAMWTRAGYRHRAEWRQLTMLSWWRLGVGGRTAVPPTNILQSPCRGGSRLLRVRLNRYPAIAGGAGIRQAPHPAAVPARALTLVPGASRSLPFPPLRLLSTCRTRGPTSSGRSTSTSTMRITTSTTLPRPS